MTVESPVTGLMLTVTVNIQQYKHITPIHQYTTDWQVSLYINTLLTDRCHYTSVHYWQTGVTIYQYTTDWQVSLYINTLLTDRCHYISIHCWLTGVTVYQYVTNIQVSLYINTLLTDRSHCTSIHYWERCLMKVYWFAYRQDIDWQMTCLCITRNVLCLCGMTQT